MADEDRRYDAEFAVFCADITRFREEMRVGLARFREEVRAHISTVRFEMEGLRTEVHRGEASQRSTLAPTKGRGEFRDVIGDS